MRINITAPVNRCPSFTDISQLLLPQPLPPTALRRMARALAPDVPLGANKGQNTLAMALTLTVSASLLLVALVISIYMQRRKRTQQTDTVAILEGMPGFMEQGV